MPIPKEKLTDIKEHYERAQKLIEEDSKTDPVTDPYRSHYAAQKILQDLENNVQNLQIDNDEDLVLRAILCCICKEIGRIHYFTEELSNAEKYFEKCLKLLKDNELNEHCINIYIDILNQSSILWSSRTNPEASKELLERAENAYKDFRAAGDLKPLELTDLFGSPDEIESGKGDLALEKLHTLTLYYLAQVYGNLGDLPKSAHYCHLTLKRQLEYNDFEAIDWALNAATLSQYYFTKNALKQSRHLLAAASYMLDKHEQNLCSSELSDDEKREKLDVLSHRSADIARCWAKYGLYILSTSKERLIQETDDGVTDGMADLTISHEFEEFKTLSLSLYENQVIDEFVLTYDDAKQVFLNAQTWLNRAKEHYTCKFEFSLFFDF